MIFDNWYTIQVITAIQNSKYHIRPNIKPASKNAPLDSKHHIENGGHPELSPSRILMIANVRIENKVVNPKFLNRFFVFCFNTAIFCILIESDGWAL
jgi:hypothetical protein